MPAPGRLAFSPPDWIQALTVFGMTLRRRATCSTVGSSSGFGLFSGGGLLLHLNDGALGVCATATIAKNDEDLCRRRGGRCGPGRACRQDRGVVDARRRAIEVAAGHVPG